MKVSNINSVLFLASQLASAAGGEIVTVTETSTVCSTKTLTVPMTVTVTPKPAPPVRPSKVAKLANEMNFIFNMAGAIKSCLPDSGITVPPSWARVQCTFYVFNLMLSLTINIIGGKDHHEFWKKRQQQWREWEEKYWQEAGDGEDEGDCSDEEESSTDPHGKAVATNDNALLSFKTTKMLMDKLGVQVYPYMNETTLQECVHYKFVKDRYKDLLGQDLVEGTVCLSQHGLATFVKLPDNSAEDTEDGKDSGTGATGGELLDYQSFMNKLRPQMYVKKFDKYLHNIKQAKFMTTWQLINFKQYSKDIMRELAYVTDQLRDPDHKHISFELKNKEDPADLTPMMSFNLL
ncbi:hypothetical protein J7295_00946 [Nakaseomyces glabratus]|nr:hypothetical protein J7298_00943 [Nakaseomyces glabratus]KAH7606629.1 hypothetical protein J7295_00946 [Nakaseomyces glabratus]KAH7614771.1 hypothetical protein J7292_00922 [Nakaseomyces glabratus]